MAVVCVSHQSRSTTLQCLVAPGWKQDVLFLPSVLTTRVNSPLTDSSSTDQSYMALINPNPLNVVALNTVHRTL